ncbi:hypothetical protein ACG04Q_19355 [Roseateles sp. DXS20W]|uniref:Uncharacterized protein n=1 Tax=Pelomonas lactea TaxID=3299030 RepID=A0ABW7GPR7_9BURK
MSGAEAFFVALIGLMLAVGFMRSVLHILRRRAAVMPANTALGDSDKAWQATTPQELRDLRHEASQMSLPDATFAVANFKPWSGGQEPLVLLREVFPSADPAALELLLAEARRLRAEARAVALEHHGWNKARLMSEFPMFGERSIQRAISLACFENR